MKEIGDFIAHRDERNNGPVTHAFSEWSAIVGYTVTRHSEQQGQFDLSNLPPQTADFLRANVKRIKEKILLKRTHTNRAKATKLVDEIIKRLARKQNGYFSLTEYSDYEYVLIRTICAYMIVEPVFSEKQIFNDLSRVLIRNDLLKKKEEALFSSLKTPIALFVGSAMHNTPIKTADGRVFKLTTAYDHQESAVQTMALVPMFSGENDNGSKFAATMFSISGTTDDLCDKYLIENSDWSDFDIEVGRDRKLTAIVASS